MPTSAHNCTYHVYTRQSDVCRRSGSLNKWDVVHWKEMRWTIIIFRISLTVRAFAIVFGTRFAPMPCIALNRFEIDYLGVFLVKHKAKANCTLDVIREFIERYLFAEFVRLHEFTFLSASKQYQRLLVPSQRECELSHMISSLECIHNSNNFSSVINAEKNSNNLRSPGFYLFIMPLWMPLLAMWFPFMGD